jgi:hypothetical protein
VAAENDNTGCSSTTSKRSIDANVRKGEKIGWIGGFFGGFIWIFLLSFVWLFRGKTIQGVCGIGIFLLAVFLIFALVPWKHPETKYWKLMVPLFTLFIASILLCVWVEGAHGEYGFNGWSILYITPALIPVFTMGSRRWNSP